MNIAYPNTLSALVGLIFGAGVLVYLLYGLYFNSPYNMLETTFEASPAAEPDKYRRVKVSFSLPRTAGIHSYSKTKYSLMDKSITLSLSFPGNLFTKPVSIPSTSVHGCSKSCFRDDLWLAKVFVSKPLVEISFDNSPAILEWCYERNLPVLNRVSRIEWSNSDSGNLDASYVDKQGFEYQTQQACYGN